MKSPKVIVSACLLGEACRYDGVEKGHEGVREALEGAQIVPFCPEAPVMGTPRGRISVVATADGLRVRKDADGTDVTELLMEETAKLVAACPDPDRVILKAKSPSCGIGTAPVVDESGKLLLYGNGVAAELLLYAFPHIDITDETLFDPSDA